MTLYTYISEDHDLDMNSLIVLLWLWLQIWAFWHNREMGTSSFRNPPHDRFRHWGSICAYMFLRFMICKLNPVNWTPQTCQDSALWGLVMQIYINEPLARYVNQRIAHVPGMPGTFSPLLRVSDPDTHHGMCVTHVPPCMPGSLTSGFLWSQWRGKRSRHSRRMRNPQFYVSCKRPMKSLTTRSMGPTWDPSGTQVGPMVAPWNLLSEVSHLWRGSGLSPLQHQVITWSNVDSFAIRPQGTNFSKYESKHKNMPFMTPAAKPFREKKRRWYCFSSTIPSLSWLISTRADFPKHRTTKCFIYIDEDT